MKAVGLVFVLVALTCLATLVAPASAQEEVQEPQVDPETQKQPGENGEKKEPGENGEEGPKKELENSQVVMQDGTFVVGQIDLEKFEVETEYGKLVVPRDQVLKIRIGKNADKELKEKIDGLIAKLGDQEFKVREEASKELAGLGRVALQELREAAKSDDIEVKTRAEKLARDIEAATPADAEEIIDDDEIVTQKFTIRGTLMVETFIIKTRYGTMTAQKKDVKTLVVTKPSFTEKAVVVSGSANAGTDAMMDTGLTIKKGEKIVIKATGTVHIRSYGISATPDGNPSRSTHFSGIPMGALMGKIGRNGKLFKVGSSYKGVADSSGKLYLGVGVRPNYSSSGDFRVKVQVQNK